MAYRNGTYVAFDGQGESNPIQSDYKYYSILQAWKATKDISFSNSHDKTYAVRDTSSMLTLQSRLRERMRNSKNMLVIVSPDTNYDRGLLNWEIDLAFELGLPIIVAYAGCDGNYQKAKLPKALRFKNARKYIYFRQGDVAMALANNSIHD